MAHQTSNYISGRVEDIVFYQRYGKYFVRVMPDKVKQAPVTKIRSRNFGIASSAGKTLRRLLLPAIPFPKDKNMQNRFSGAIAKWLELNSLKDLPSGTMIPYVQHFNFNEKASIAERFKIPIAVMQPSANQIKVHIPAFVPAKRITAPAHTTIVICTITAASCSPKDSAASGSFTVTFEIPYGQDLINEQTLSFPVGTSNGILVITAASFRYVLTGKKLSDNISFMPSSVIDARYCWIIFLLSSGFYAGCCSNPMMPVRTPIGAETWKEILRNLLKDW